MEFAGTLSFYSTTAITVITVNIKVSAINTVTTDTNTYCSNKYKCVYLCRD